MNKNILSTKNWFLDANFEIIQFVVGKVVNPCLVSDLAIFDLSLVKSLPTILKITSRSTKIRSWYSYQRNLKSLYQRHPKNLQNPCQYCVCRFTNEMTKKSSLVNSQILFYQGFKAKIKKRASTLYINIYRNPP